MRRVAPLFCFWVRDASRAIPPQSGPIDGAPILRHAKGMIAALRMLHRVVLLAALTVALVATGFAHRLQADQDEALAFALQNGISLSDICGDMGKGLHAGAECQACQIAGTADLPPATGARIDLELVFAAEVVAPLETRAILHRSDPAHRPQGPPVA